MSILRAFYRLLCIIIISLIFVFIGVMLHFLFSRKPQRHFHYIGVFTNYWAKCFCYFLNIRLQIEGGVDLHPNALIICNHVGSSDIFVLGSCFKTFFVSKDDIANWPLIGMLSKLGYTIFVDRSRKHQIKETINNVAKRLGKGFSVSIFPESRATDGLDVIPFKTAFFEAAVLTGRPVIPVMIRYLDSNIPSVACWMNVSFSSHFFRLLKNPILDARVQVFPNIFPKGNRRVLAEESRSIIRKAFNEMGK